jgi:hypothetical protein
VAWAAKKTKQAYRNAPLAKKDCVGSNNRQLEASRFGD